MKKKYGYSKVMAIDADLRTESAEWMAEWRQIHDFLIPGRGIFNQYTKPRKRKLTSPRVINSVGEDALYVLTSGMHGQLTSPAVPWFVLEWADDKLATIEPLRNWLAQCNEILHKDLHESNFYSIINSFYIEYTGFGTGCMYVGEDSDEEDTAPFRFELLTAGEYQFSVNTTGRANIFTRTIFMSTRQLVERFPTTVSKEDVKRVKENKSGIDKINRAIIEFVTKGKFMDKPYTRIYYEITSGGTNVPQTGPTQRNADKEPLEVSGFYEWPYPVGRWNTIGSDTLGIGPGSRALPDIKRLQEMEKAFLMATHKSIDPPINAPARMKGKLNTLPGGRNYYSNPNEKVNELYSGSFDYTGVGSAIERVENRIKTNFFNDIFLTGSRDPNASPLRTGQVTVQEKEKLHRLGPVVNRLQHEFFHPIIERCFNIELRKGNFPILSPDLAKMAGSYKITLTSPLAVAQREAAINNINSFYAFIGNVAQFDQAVLDNADSDSAARKVAKLSGVTDGLNSEDKVRAIRAARAKQIAAEKNKADMAEAAQASGALQQSNAATSKAQSEAGLNMLESQKIAQDLGM